jgi:hypothetical protein
MSALTGVSPDKKTAVAMAGSVSPLTVMAASAGLSRERRDVAARQEVDPH